MTNRRLLPLLVAHCALLATTAPLTAQTATPRAVDPAAGALLERVRTALGTEALEGAPRGWITRGTGEVFGLEQEAEFLFRADGKFQLTVRGEVSRVLGYDGKTAWSEDAAGLRRAVVLEDRDRWTLVNMLLSGSWATSRSGLECVPHEAGGAASVDVSWPGDGLTVTVELDPETWLPKALRHPASAGETTWRLGDWREAHGFRFPHSWERLEGGEPADIYGFGALEPSPDYFVDPFAYRRVQPEDARFDASVPAELELKRTRTGHLLVHPSIDGQDVGWFIFDTGAGAMCIDPEIADELELPAFGELTAVGVGGNAKTGFRRAGSLTLGAVTLEEPTFVELDLSAIGTAFGVPVGGIIGYELIARTVVEIEVEGPRISLHDPATYRLAEAPWQPLVLSGGLPCVPARFEDRDGLFKLDTGAPGTVSFHAPAVVSMGLLEGREVGRTMIGGVGGMRAAKSGTLAWFELAGHRFDAPGVTFAEGTGGAFADTYTTGNIGQRLLAPFRLVLDYPHDRLAFVPR